MAVQRTTFKDVPVARKSQSWLALLTKVLLAYVVYLGVWQCPVNRPLTSDGLPCVAVHKTWDLAASVVSPLYQQHVQHHVDPLVANAQPYVAHVQPYVAQAGRVLGPHAKRLGDFAHANVVPHFEAVRTGVQHQVETLSAPYWAAISQAYDQHLAAHVNQAHGHVQQATALAHTHLGPVADRVWYWINVVSEHAWLHFQETVLPALQTAFSIVSRESHKLYVIVDKWFREEVLVHINRHLNEHVIPHINQFRATLSDSLRPSDWEAKSTTAATAASTVQASTTPEVEVVPEPETVEEPVPEPEATPEPEPEAELEDEEPVTVFQTVQTTVTVHTEPEAATETSAPEVDSDQEIVNKPKRAGVDWFKRVKRTAKGASRNLQEDAAAEQRRLTDAAKPEFMKLLRELSSFGEAAVGELQVVMEEVEAAEGDIEDEKAVYEQFDAAAQELQDKTLAIRDRARQLADETVENIEKLRKEALEAMDDFFDVVLLEASREASRSEAVEDADDDVDTSGWTTWRDYNRLKKFLKTTREKFEKHELELDIVNVALKESQDASVLLGQEFANHLSGLRGRSQFLIQQHALMKIKEQEDAGIPFAETVEDAIYYEILDSLPENDEADAEHEAPEPETPEPKSETVESHSAPVGTVAADEVKNPNDADYYHETVTTTAVETFTQTRRIVEQAQ